MAGEADPSGQLGRRGDTPRQPGPTDGYGYLWWIAPIANHQTYAAFGIYGQMIMVVPDLELVVAVLSRPTETPDMDVQPMVHLVEGAIIPHLP